jgi:glycosyltransferase involved in cell wall biosynthesis
MRILIDGGSSGSGGYIRYLRGILAPGRVPQDAEVCLLCSPELAGLLGTLDDNVEVLKEPVLSAPSRLTRVGWWIRSFPRLVRRLDPDVVLYASGTKRGDINGVPSVAIHHIMAPFNRHALRKYGLSRQTLQLLFWRARYARSYRNVDGVIFHAEYTRDEISRQVRGIKRTTLVPNALEHNFRTDAPPARRPLGDPVKVLCVSTIFLFKHQWNVVEAVKSLRAELLLDIRLSIVGGGEPIAKKKLARRIEELDAGSFTTVAEGIPLDDMPALYRDADLFVFPSADETWPITLLEAMGAGLSIACADRMAMPDLLRDGGVYFDPEDPRSIASAVRGLVEDPELRLRCARRAYEYVGEYTWERSAEQVYDFLRVISEGAD